MRITRLAVRELADAVFRSGDLYPVRRGRQISAEEGIRIQGIVQAQRGVAHQHYQREIPVESHCLLGEETVSLSGRVDGCYPSADGIVVEEIKTCGSLPGTAHQVDLGQALIYAGLLTELNLCGCTGDSQVHVDLVYVEADTLQERTFRSSFTGVSVRRLLAFVLLCFDVRWHRHLARVSSRLTWSEALEFPLDHYRVGQQATARRVYRAQQRREHLLLEAPTGSGKSLATLFPSVKGLGLHQQIFFLTARNTGAISALRAARQLNGDVGRLSAVQIIAKEKICPIEGMPCGADSCERARGYFDRVSPAIDQLLEQGVADSQAVQVCADSFQLCPFELSLDAARWTDLIIGDYNYIFDPVVRLNRFAGDEDIHLLIDEAHQLVPRVRDMLRVELDQEVVRAAARTTSATLARRARSLQRALNKVRRLHGEGDHVLDDLGSIDRACEKFLAAIQEEDFEFDHDPELAALYFACHRWVRSKTWLDRSYCRFIARIRGRTIQVASLPLDVSHYIADLASEYASSVRFSGTLSPLPLYQRLQGEFETCPERAPNPFSSDQARVMVVADIPTIFSRRLDSLPDVVNLIRVLAEIKPGRYVIAMPSYQYMNQLLEMPGITSIAPVFHQQRGATQADLEQLIDEFASLESAFLIMVMGGSLSESIEFGDARLDGIVVIGLGLPPPDLERDLLAEYFEDQENQGLGQLIAYTQPALVKNLQAAGRLIRNASDRGVICLVDFRFAKREVMQFFPSHWRPILTRSSDIRRQVEDFWAN